MLLAFDAPVWLLLLLLVPPVLMILRSPRLAGGRVMVSFSSWGGEPFPTPRSMHALVLQALRVVPYLLTSLLVLALARPVVLDQRRVVLNQGREIIFLVDLSPSMAAQDNPGTSRLDLVKQSLRDFVSNRSNDAIGLVGFATEASLLSPPTQDYATLLDRIDAMEVLSLGEGTSIGLGLSLSALYFSPGESQGRILVLISDGDNNGGEVSPSQGAQLLAGMGVRTHTVGLGSDRPVELVLEVPDQGILYKGIYQGTVNETLLRQIASVGKGSHFPAPGGQALADSLRSINGLEPSDVQYRQEVAKIPVHPWLLTAFMVIFLIDLLIRRWYLREAA